MKPVLAECIILIYSIRSLHSMNRFEGKVALVSAASSGIGRGIAKVLAQDGCRVHIFSRDENAIEKAASDLNEISGSSVSCSTGDLSSSADLKRIMSEAREKAGNIDFLVVNYGDPKIAPFMDISEKDWDSAFSMILKSSVILVREALPYMLNNGGRIVFVTSLTTKQPLENFALSASLRSAVVSLSKVISLEYAGKGVTSNSISQGYFMTPRLEAVADGNSKRYGITLDEAYERIKQEIPAGRVGRPEEIGHLVSFLCSEEASYVNGTNIQIDGGLVRFPF